MILTMILPMIVDFFIDPKRDQCIVSLEKFWEDSGIVMGVFDFSQPQTLRNLTKWVDRALKQAGEMHPIVVLIGNKKGKIYYPTILSLIYPLLTTVLSNGYPGWGVQTEVTPDLTIFDCTHAHVELELHGLEKALSAL